MRTAEAVRQDNFSVTRECTEAAFPAMVTPVLPLGAIPVFADVKAGTCDVDVSRLEEARSSKNKREFPAHGSGNPFDLKAVGDFCDRHGLWLIEDNCNTLGADYDAGFGFQKTGSIGASGTSSFHPARPFTMGGDDAVHSNSDPLSRILSSPREQGRDSTCRHRFDGHYGKAGHKLKFTDVQAVTGCAQLKKNERFVQAHRNHWQTLKDRIANAWDALILPEYGANARPGWFGFPMTVQNGLERERMVRYAEN